MEQVTRKLIFARAAVKLRGDFEELRNVPHAALKGREGEKIVGKFLNEHLPKRFAAGSGFIIDQRDRISKQADVVVYDALNCPLYRASEDASIFPNDNVAAVVEVKAVLDKQKLEGAAENIAAAKRLAKTRPPPLPFLVNFETVGMVFAFGSALTLEKVAQHHADIIRKQRKLGEHIDFIFVLDEGMVCLSSSPPHAPEWAPALIQGRGGAMAEGWHIAVSSQSLGKGTLDAFLRTLLAHLQFFRGLADHPGFNWSPAEGASLARLIYLTSITHETDPEKREKKLRQYKEVARRDFQAKRT